MALFKIFKGTDIKKLTDPDYTIDGKKAYIDPVNGYCYFDATTGLFFVDAENNDGDLVRAPINANKAIYDAYGNEITAANYATKNEGAFFINGSGTTDSTAKISTWVGSSDRITNYYDGLTIRYKIGIAGQSTVTLNINELGAKTVYRFNTTKLTTHFPVGSIINLIYHEDLNGGCWLCNDYDANTNTQLRVYRQDSSSYNGDYPLIASKTKASALGTVGTESSQEAVYGLISDTNANIPTTNPYSGETKIKTLTVAGNATATKFIGSLEGNADTATRATSANKLNTNAGSTTQPVYFSGGVPVAITYQLNTTVPADADFSNTTYTFATGDGNGQIKITPSGGTAQNISVKGLGSAAFTASTAYDPAGSAQQVKNDLLNGAGAAYDTLKELGALIDENTDAIDALETVAANKAANTVTITGTNGLTGGGNLTTNRTISANLLSTTKLTNAAATATETSGRVYPVAMDKNGKLAVNVPWTDTNTTYNAATTSANGLMTSAMVIKLNGIAEGANKYSLPTASSSTLGGVKIGNNINISNGVISVPTASGTTAGVAIVYPAASCTTFSSDSGAVTPLAVQKGAKMFAIPRITATNKAITRFSGTEGEVQNSTILIEDVTNTRNSEMAQIISIPAASGTKKMVYGYCTDQIDGTSFIGGLFDANATEFPYSSGLAIGGSSGNLLWKGDRVATASDISGKAPTAHASNATTYGIGTSSNYGHVKLSDSTSSTSAASAGIAASPAAVKAAYDLAASKANSNHTHNYAGSSSPGGVASQASRLSSTGRGGYVVAYSNEVSDPIPEYGIGRKTENDTNAWHLNGTVGTTSSLTYDWCKDTSTGTYAGSAKVMMDMNSGSYTFPLRAIGTTGTTNTVISANADLNTVNYLEVGTYIKRTNIAVTNCPIATNVGFIMSVYSPNSSNDMATTNIWVYRVRKILSHDGDEYIQYAYSGSTAGSFTYGPWKKIITSADTVAKATADANGNNIINTYAKKPVTYTASITTTWSGAAAPYTQNITVSGITALDEPIVDIILSTDYDTSQSQLVEWGKIYKIVTAANQITVYATEKTTAALSIHLKVIN